jgi:hypothetical protein
MRRVDIFGYTMIFFYTGNMRVYLFSGGRFSAQMYCVRHWREQVLCERPDETADAADLLARVTTKCKKLVDYMYDKYPDNEVQRLKQNYNPNKIMETPDKHVYGV